MTVVEMMRVSSIAEVKFNFRLGRFACSMGLLIFAVFEESVPLDAKDPSSLSEFVEMSRRVKLGLSPSPELDGLINDYERLIKEKQGQEGVEWAMWDVARLYSFNNDANADPIGDSLQKSIAWFRRAIEIAAHGQSLWQECQFGLASQLRVERGSATALMESRSIIEDLRRRLPEDPLVQLRCQEQMVLQLIAEGQISDAEQICRQILALEEPKGQFEQAVVPERLHGCQFAAINSLLQGALRRSEGARVSDKWLDNFVNDFPDNPQVKSAVATVRHMMRNSKSSPLTSMGRGARVQRGIPGWLIAVNVAVLAIAVIWKRCWLV